MQMQLVVMSPTPFLKGNGLLLLPPPLCSTIHTVYIYRERESRGSIALAMLLHAALFDRLMSLEKVATDLISILFPHLFNNHVITTCLVH